MKKIGIALHPLNIRAPQITEELISILRSQQIEHWTCSAWDAEKLHSLLGNTDLVLTVGGDGTILRVAQILAGRPIPITGINLGKLGFLTEIPPGKPWEKLFSLLAGKGWIDQRAMLEAKLVQFVGGQQRTTEFCALNDIVVARGSIARIIEVTASIDGTKVATYKADGALVSSATGSTGYALAAGGPILNPKSTDLLLMPILPHLSLKHPLVLEANNSICLQLSTTSPATLSIDGHISIELNDGDSITITGSNKKTRFLRIDPPEHFYASLNNKLRG